MADNISGIKPVPPAYPVKRPQPPARDRESGNRKKDPPAPQRTPTRDDDDEDKPVIDEYI